MSSQRLPQSKDADKPLSLQQQSIVDHILTTGQSIPQTAEALGMAVSNVYRTLRYPHVKKELQARTLEHIGILAPYAARTQMALLQADSESVRASVAEYILHRHLGKPVTRSQVAVGGIISVNIDLG